MISTHGGFIRSRAGHAILFPAGQQLYLPKIRTREWAERWGNTVSAEGFLHHLDFYVTTAPHLLPQQWQPACLDPAAPPSAAWVPPHRWLQRHGRGPRPPCFIPGQGQPRQTDQTCVGSPAPWESTAHMREI